MDGHSILGIHHWMAQLQICCKEGVGKGSYSWKSNQSCQKRLGGSVSVSFVGILMFRLSVVKVVFLQKSDVLLSVPIARVSC